MPISVHYGRNISEKNVKKDVGMKMAIVALKIAASAINSGQEVSFLWTSLTKKDLKWLIPSI